jgi:hypothetical protein
LADFLQRLLCPERLPDWSIRVMQGTAKEEWKQLCEQAAVEQDPEKLMLLVSEITRMLDEKEERLKLQQSNSDL